MENVSELERVTEKLLRRVEALVDQGDQGPADLKQLAAIVKDLKDILKERTPKEAEDTGLKVVLEGEVAQYAH